ncbi:hypothetical protein AVEN_154919-1 [Araneus ventricosus]|uniref:Uncharacterized protein n=1 Tax=Araneus ventricosus TaxID=182803 RepID=A0A4Y2A838_ARAVE|nr:hypothetical protein AVEN_154919-1 [Araneus ventricosus]
MGHRKAIQLKRPGMLRDGVILLHDNTHTVRKIQKLLESSSGMSGAISNTNQMDLAPSLGSNHLSGTLLSSNSDVKTSAENWLTGQGNDFYQARLNKLVLISDKGLNRFSDYVEN